MKDIFTSTDELIEEYSRIKLTYSKINKNRIIERESKRINGIIGNLKGRLEVFKAWREYDDWKEELRKELSSQIKKIEEVLK